MPATYAHYRFGAESIPVLPKELRLSVGRFRRLYDVGLHGPDPFFHYNILMDTPVGRLGSAMHRQTGREFFTRACKRLKAHPSEAGAVYLYGFLAHFALDSICHPFINQTAAEGQIGHVELETEFDRFLLELDDRLPPHRQDLSRHLKLSKNEAATAAELIPPATGYNVYRACRYMALNTHLLATVNPKVVSWALHFAGKNIADQQMPPSMNQNCAHLDGALYSLYQQALVLYPQLVRELTDHIRSGAPLGEDFEKDFG